MKRRVVVRGVSVLGGKMHAIKHKPYGDRVVDYWCTVGGGVDEGEGLVEALRREYVEETGIVPDIGGLLFVQQFIGERDYEKTEFLEFFFLVKNAKDYQSIDFAQTTHGSHEVLKSDFIDQTDVSYNMLPKFLQGVDCDNLPTQTQYFNYI